MKFPVVALRLTLPPGLRVADDGVGQLVYQSEKFGALLVPVMTPLSTTMSGV